MGYMESRTHDYMKRCEAEYNELCERLCPPLDWQNPEWEVEEKVHNWRNYASKDLKGIWQKMSGKNRLIIAALLNDIAGREDWD